jgi:hypothetical protein
MAESFSAIASQPAFGETLCSRCRDLLSVSGAAISLLTATNVAALCASGDHYAALEEAQFTLGEGPSREAFLTGQPVLEDQLSSAAPIRWPALAGLVRDARVEGIFAFPLQIGAVRTGVLTLYQKEQAAWSQAQHADALIAADALTHVILSIQAKAPPGALAEALRDVGSYRAEVHQASGMLSAQADISVSEALVRLRSLAYVSERLISDLALAVIARRLRLELLGPNTRCTD